MNNNFWSSVDLKTSIRLQSTVKHIRYADVGSNTIIGSESEVACPRGSSIIYPYWRRKEGHLGQPTRSIINWERWSGQHERIKKFKYKLLIIIL